MASSAVPSGNEDCESSSQNGVIDTIHVGPGSKPKCSSVVSSQLPFPNSDPPVTESWCCTGAKVIRFKFTWTIQNFSSRPEKVGEILESSTFPAGSNGELKWTLRAHPKGRRDAEDYFSLYLNLVSSSYKGTELPVKYQLVLLNDKYEIAKCKSGERPFFPGSKCQNWGFSKFIELDFLLNQANGLLPDGNLIIVCEGAATVENVNTFGLSSKPETEIPQRSLPENLSSFENEEFSDITFSVGGKDILAHKKILAAKSPLFAATFKCKVEESKPNRVVITDMKYEVFREMLRYIYTGKSSNIETMAEDLLAAAGKYDLSELKKMCETVLCSRLTVTNAADLLVLSDMHCAKQLKAQAICFINKCAKEVMLTPTWKNMSLNHPHVIIEALEALASHSFQ